MKRLVATSAHEVSPSLSPDGKQLAYVSDETERQEVYLRPVPGPGASVQVSVGDANQPVWAHDGRELFYRTGTPRDSMSFLVSASIVDRPSVAVVRRDTLFEDRFVAAGLHGQYDVFPNGKEFVMLKKVTVDDTTSARIVVLTNWTRELTRGTPKERPY